MRSLRFAMMALAAVGLAACGTGIDPQSNTEEPGAQRSLAATSATPAPIDSSLALFFNGGGCYPPALSTTGLDLLTQVNPEWAPVVQGGSPFSTPVLLHGTAAVSHVSREDFPAGHISYDQNTDLFLDAQDQGLLATGNGRNKLTLEWETVFFPAWAWPAPGDRVVALGRWIFDCGHGDPNPGSCHGTGHPCLFDVDCAPGVSCEGTVWNFETELHPPQAVAVIRSGRGAALGGDEDDGDAVPVTRTDVFVSGSGGGAADLCVVTHRDSVDEVLAAPCFPLSMPLALLPSDAPPLNSTDFSFEVPLPPAPRGRSPVWRVEPRPTPEVSGVAVPARLEVTPLPHGGRPRLLATVHMTEKVGGLSPTGFAATLLAAWRDQPGPRLQHVRVTLDGVVVHDARKPPGLAPGLPNPPGWRMQALVGGLWQELQGLEAVDVGAEGKFFPVAAVFDQFLPNDGTLGVSVGGASAACVDILFGRSLLDSLIAFGGDLPAAQACLFSNDPGIGLASASFSGPRFGARNAPYEILSQGGSCSVSRPVDCLVDGDCPAGETCEGIGSFSLRFRIDRID